MKLIVARGAGGTYWLDDLVVSEEIVEKILGGTIQPGCVVDVETKAAPRCTCGRPPEKPYKLCEEGTALWVYDRERGASGPILSVDKCSEELAGEIRRALAREVARLNGEEA